VLDALKHDGERFFTFRGSPMTNASASFSAAGARAGPWPDVVFHTPSHTLASTLAERCVSASEIQRLLGHSSLAMIRRCVHASDERLRDALPGLNLGRPDLQVARPTKEREK
jgi:integrase